MRYAILEDEKLASNRLKQLVTDMKPDYKCVVVLDSVESAVISLPALKVDLVFMDIQLADGISFDIFDQIKFDVPIIFITAYDEYALTAFKTNSVDYLLKPIDPVDLARALDKFEKHAVRGDDEIDKLMKSLQPKGKERFVVKIGDHLKTVSTQDIQLIYSQHKGTYLFDKQGRKFLVDYTLDKLEDMLNTDQFFRISRKYLVQADCINDIISYTNSRLEIKISGFDEEQIIVSRERVQEFKNWLDR